MDFPRFSEQNAHSLVFNNLTGLIRAEFRKSTPFISRSNAIHNEMNYTPELNDSENFDYRPKADLSLVDAGISVFGITDNFEGNTPDIGAC